MKSIPEIEKMLVAELLTSVDKVRSIGAALVNYNEVLGEASYMLAGLLESHLKKEFNDWDQKKWIDDCLFSMVKINDQTLSIWGVVIWGEEDGEDMEQFTEPFYYEIELTPGYFKRYTFLFGDLDEPEVAYSVFKYNRNYWTKRSNENWSPAERNWKYVINSKTD